MHRLTGLILAILLLASAWRSLAEDAPKAPDSGLVRQSAPV